MQEYDRLEILLHGGFQGDLEPLRLSRADLCIIGTCGFGLHIHPAARAADAVFTVCDAVVMQELQGIQPVFRKERLHLFHCAPPVIVIALEDDLFFAGKRIQPLEIRKRLLHIHSP